MEIRAIITSASDEILIVKTFLLVVSSFNALSIVESFFRMNHVYLHVYVVCMSVCKQFAADFKCLHDVRHIK